MESSGTVPLYVDLGAMTSRVVYQAGKRATRLARVDGEASGVTRRKLQTPGNAEEHKRQETPTTNPIGPTNKPHRPSTKHHRPTERTARETHNTKKEASAVVTKE